MFTMIHLHCRRQFVVNPCDSSSHCKHYAFHAETRKNGKKTINFPSFPQKRTTLQGISEYISLAVSVPFDFPLRIYGNFSWNLSVPFATHFKMFENFG